MAAKPSDEIIAIIKSTAPALQKHGVAITTRMYERLFENEEIKTMFDMAAQDNGEQQKRLAAAILAYAKNIDKLEALESAVATMNRRHIETGVHEEHYPYVAEALLAAIKDVLGDAIDEKTLAAWGEAYWYLADILIAKEKTLYAAA